MEQVKVFLIVALMLLAGQASAQTTIGPTWETVSTFHVNTGPPRQYIGPVFVISSNSPPSGPPADTWQEVDLTAAPWNVGVTAKAAFLAGLVIISSGNSAPETDSAGIIFRAPGDTRISCSTANFIGQTIFQVNTVSGVILGGGQRAAMATWVPVVNGKIEYCWTRNTTGSWPNSGAYGFNLAVQAWAE
jgi:hypothetical protein